MRAKLFTALCLIIILSACNSEKDPLDIDQPTYNLEDIQVTIDNVTVYEDENVTFDIKGRGDFLTFFSGEEGNVYQVDANGGVKHTGRIDYYTYAFKEEGTYDVHFVFATKDGKERVLGPFSITVEVDPDKEPVPDPNALVEKTITIHLGPQNSAEESFLVDLANISGHSTAGAFNKQGQIDILAIWARPATRPTNSEGWPTLYVIGSPSYGGTGIAAPALTWTTRNAGKLIRLDNPTQDELDQFDQLTNGIELGEAYEGLATSVQNRSGWNVSSHGPANSVSFRDVVDAIATASAPAPVPFASYKLAQEEHVSVIYFKSEARNLYAAFKLSITTYPTAYGNSINAALGLEVKSFLAP